MNIKNIKENNEMKSKLEEEIYKKINEIPFLIDELENIFFDIKNKYGGNFEHLLSKIHENIITYKTNNT